MEHLEGYFELEDYGVKLKRLTHDKIEMLRLWRNDPKIQKYMHFRQEITAQMQEEWFSNLDLSKNFYFIIEFDSKEIGLINIKDVDFELKTGESGIFIYDDSYLNKGVSYRASLCQRDFGFITLGLNTISAHILKDNPRSIAYNIKFGFILANGQNDEYCQKYILTKQAYFENKNKIISSLNEYTI